MMPALISFGRLFLRSIAIEAVAEWSGYTPCSAGQAADRRDGRDARDHAHAGTSARPGLLTRQMQGRSLRPLHAGRSCIFTRWSQDHISIRSCWRCEIWVAETETQASTQLTPFGLVGSPSWSPDSLQIAFDSEQGARTNIFVMSADAGRLGALLQVLPRICVPSWSRDANSIYFASDRIGEFETPSQPAIQVTRGGGFRALESPDGKYLYYAKGRGKPGLWRRNLLDGEALQLVHAAR
jgi:Tol biopolymer transport system component